jgi:hypothetical protein
MMASRRLESLGFTAVAVSGKAGTKIRKDLRVNIRSVGLHCRSPKSSHGIGDRFVKSTGGFF